MKVGKPAAKKSDQVVGIDTHVIMIPSPGGPVPTPMPMPFSGQLSGSLSADVKIADKAAAVKGSTADNSPTHIPAGGPFQAPPANRATIQTGSTSVYINDKPAAHLGDTAMTCNDPADAPNGKVIGSGTVFIGD